MKILQINTVCGIGSTGRIAVDLYKTLEKNGHKCVIAYGRGKAPENIKTIKIGNKLDNYIHYALSHIFDNHCRNSIIATKKFIKEIEKYNPDIIHIHNIHGYYLNMSLLLNYLKKIEKPIIWTLHDCWTFTGHCAYFDYVGCDKWKSQCSLCPQKKSYPSSILIDNSRKNYRLKRKKINNCSDITFVTPSKWLANLVRESFLRGHDIKVINNGIDLNRFKPTKSNFKKILNIEDKYIILGVASAWEKRKGLNTFIELSKKLDDNYKIILIGIAEKMGKEIPENIVCISRTNNVEELAQYYTMADIFVNSTLEDNFPTTNIESLACGTPVITYNTGGSVEAITKEFCGRIVKDNNLDELIDCIKELQKMKYDRNDISKEAQQYSKEIRYNEYIQLYKEILGEKQ